ncbi:MAG: hypothetical protein E3J82_01510 [Candidatus Thorarchaeota archaeon]|nr:MAG: hypothetical protein E3J82_01510 [Candidatus Thorarchaeota archaeon]
MAQIPLQKNTVSLTTLAMIAALGIVVRMFVRIPVIPGFVELTPGFLFSLLGGVIGGVPGGIFVGAIVGIGGAMGGGEPPLLPMIGNIFLGIGSGLAIHVTKERNSRKYALMVVLGGGIIGGFIPTATVFASLIDPIEVILAGALLDMTQGFLWAIVALFVERSIIRPIAGKHLYPEPEEPTLDESTMEAEDTME